MTLDELIEELQCIRNDSSGDLEVKFAYNYGDYWRTRVAETVDTVEVGTVVHSEYHNMTKVVEYDAEDAATGAEAGQPVILLS